MQNQMKRATYKEFNEISLCRFLQRQDGERLKSKVAAKIICDLAYEALERLP